MHGAYSPSMRNAYIDCSWSSSVLTEGKNSATIPALNPAWFMTDPAVASTITCGSSYKKTANDASPSVAMTHWYVALNCNGEYKPQL